MTNLILFWSSRMVSMEISVGANECKRNSPASLFSRIFPTMQHVSNTGPLSFTSVGRMLRTPYPLRPLPGTSAITFSCHTGYPSAEVPVHVRSRHVHLAVLVDAEAGVAVLVVHQVAAQAVGYRDVRIRSRRRDLQHAKNCRQNCINTTQFSSILFYCGTFQGW